MLADCVPCISHHYQEAVNAGLAKEAIAEALAISMVVIASTKRAKYKQVINELDEVREKNG